MLGILNCEVLVGLKLFQNFGIVIENNKIIDVDKSNKLKEKYKFDEVIDGKNRIVIPGLIDCHMHSYQVATKGRTCDKTLLDWLKKYIWPWEASLSKEKARACAQLAYLEMLKSGTTTFADYTSVHHTDEAFKVAQEFGMRAFIGKTMMDQDSPKGLIETTKESLRETEALIKKWHGKEQGRLKYMITPRFDLTCSDELLLGCKKLSEKYTVMIQTHAQENQGEIEIEKKKFGAGAIGHLDRLGLLGPETLLTHCVWLSEKDIWRLVSTKTNIVHCPGSNMMLASGVAPVRDLIYMKLHVGLGSDVGAYYNFSMFEQMRLACLLQKIHLLRQTEFNHKVVFEMATVHGARCLNQGKLGEIRKGNRADIVLLDKTQLQFVPFNDPIAQIVYGGTPNAVNDVIVDGKVLMRDRELLVVNEEGIIENAKEVLKN